MQSNYFAVKSIKIHPDYDYETHENDIGIIQLNEDLIFDEYTQNIQISGSRDSDPFDNSKSELLKVSGWGLTPEGMPNILRKLKVNHDPCRRYIRWTGKLNFDSLICAKGQEPNSKICGGDSGSGLVKHDLETNEYTLIGIVSFGLLKCNIWFQSVKNR